MNTQRQAGAVVPTCHLAPVYHQMRLAYLINLYPAVSHSFIRREILALERQGHDVMRIAVRGWDNDPPDADDQRERARTRYLLQGGAGPLIRACLRLLALRPGAMARAAALTFTISRRADRSPAVHLIYPRGLPARQLAR